MTQDARLKQLLEAVAHYESYHRARMFSGTHEHAVNSKGRAHLPDYFFAPSSRGKGIDLRGFKDPSLPRAFVFDVNEFPAHLTNDEIERMCPFMFDLPINDKQQILITAEVKAQMNLAKKETELIFVGRKQYFELWSKPDWENYLQNHLCDLGVLAAS